MQSMAGDVPEAFASVSYRGKELARLSNVFYDPTTWSACDQIKETETIA